MNYAETLRHMTPGTREHIILRHLIEHGAITTFEAFARYNITRLSASVYELRHAHGIPVACSKEVTERTENGRKIVKSFARYYLPKGAE